MKITEKQFVEEILPGLRKKAKSGKDLKVKAQAFLDGVEIVDEDGNPAEIELISLGSQVSGEAAMDDEDDELEKMEDEEDENDKAEEDDDDEEERAKRLTATVRKAVVDAFKSIPATSNGKRVANEPEHKAGKPDMRIPANVKRCGTIKHFKPRQGGVDADVRAYRFGMWCLAGMGHDSAKRYCQQNGLALRSEKAHVTNINAQGGFLVPEEFGTDLIDLREQYGVFRANAMVRPMASDTRTDPRRKGGLDAVFVGEDATTTTTKKEWDQVRLTAKKLMILTRYTNEINEDAVISIGDDLAGEISYAFALKEDQCGFNGDGTSTYGGIVGVFQSLLGLSGTVANIAGIVQGSGSGWDGLTLANFNAVVGRLPEYADGGNAKWYVSKAFWASVMQRLAYAAGGNTTELITEGVRKSFLGYPVEISQVLPRASAADELVAIFGDLRKGASFGDRRTDTIMFSEHAKDAFENDAIAIRGTERFDINVHDVGNASATASLREPGPIVALRTD